MTVHNPHRTAAVLAIGDELILGQTLDTNSQWISEQLSDLAFRIVEHATVPDDRAAIADAIRRLAAKAELLIITGGLGPTADDLTRHGLADALNQELIEDPEALELIKAYYPNKPMPQTNRVQALRPTNATILPNTRGTAPGLYAKLPPSPPNLSRARKEAPIPLPVPPPSPSDLPHQIFALPGPPSELHAMFQAQVLPRLNPPTNTRIKTRLLHTVGLGESNLAERLGGLMDRTRNPLVGTTASGAIVTCRLRYEGKVPEAEADKLLDQTEQLIEERLAPHIFGKGEGTTLQSAILNKLSTKNQTLAVAESCTGGLLGSLLTQVPGSSNTFRGGWITYTNQMKHEQLGVPQELFPSPSRNIQPVQNPPPPGAVSRQCAQAMAEGGLRKSGADHCLAITGIAGPSGGTEEKPVGTVWIALASRTPASQSVPLPSRGIGVSPVPPSDPPSPTILTRHFRFIGDRQAVRHRAANSALAMLWFALNDSTQPTLPRQVD